MDNKQLIQQLQDKWQNDTSFREVMVKNSITAASLKCFSEEDLLCLGDAISYMEELTPLTKVIFG